MHIATVAPSAAANRLAPIRSFLIDSAPGAGFSSPDFQIFFASVGAADLDFQSR
jgi:hypothetical protein